MAQRLILMHNVCKRLATREKKLRCEQKRKRFIAENGEKAREGKCLISRNRARCLVNSSLFGHSGVVIRYTLILEYPFQKTIRVSAGVQNGGAQHQKTENLPNKPRLRDCRILRGDDESVSLTRATMTTSPLVVKPSGGPLAPY